MNKELAKAFEDVTTNNVKAILDHGNQTRKMLKEMESKIESLRFMIQSQNETINLLRTQLAAVQAKVYQGGT